MNAPNNLVRKAFALAIAVMFGAAPPAALALSYDYQGLSFALDTRLTEGVSVRAESRDSSLIGISHGGKAYSNNADLGDLNFGAGSVTNAVSKITPALTVTYGDYGVFVRGNYTFDPTQINKNFQPAAYFGAGHEYSENTRRAANDAIQDQVGSNASILDAYVYGNFNILGRSLNIKIGRQVVNWGESTLVLNGLNSLVAVNANRAYTPGLELDEVTIPSTQIVTSINLVENVSAEAFYQLLWDHSIAPVSGSYLETNDYVGPGGVAGNIDFGRAPEYSNAGAACTGFPAGVSCVPYGGSIPRGPDGAAKNLGQYGGALRFSIPRLNNTELALYAANYHSRLPVFSTYSVSSGNQDAQTGSVFAEYPEDIHMYGASFNTTLPFGFALQGEYSYKQNQPLEIDDVEQLEADLGAPSQINPTPGATLGNQYIRGYRRKPVSLFDIGTTKIFSPSHWFGYDDLLLIGEIAVVHVNDLEPESVLRYEGPGTFLPGDARGAALSGVPVQQGGFATSTSWGYKILARATYNNIAPGVAFKPTLRWEQDVGGVTPAPLYNFVRGSRLLSPIAAFEYKNATTAEVGYAYYFGGGQNNLIRDRDYAFFDIKYSF